VTTFLVSAFGTISPVFATPWWLQRNVIIAGNPRDDYAAANQGQVKNVATAAYDEFNERLPGGAGASVEALIKSWHQLDANGDFLLDASGHRIPRQSTQTEDYAVVTLGQLKNVATPFYDRFAELGLSSSYPWPLAETSDDYAIVNLGEVKHTFSFFLESDSDLDGLSDLQEFQLGTDPTNPDSDGDAMKDGWEVKWGGNPNVWNNPNFDSDGDGLSDYNEFVHGSDPFHKDTDHDGLSDLAEVQQGRNLQKKDHPLLQLSVLGFSSP
jgi:hypothetical protein